MILFLTHDLMMASNAQSHARQHEVTLVQVGSLDKVFEVLEEQRPHALLIDLQTPQLDIADLGARLKTLSDARVPVTIGYAQHVNVDRLEQAREAGLDQVLTRGQINSQMGRIIADSR